MLIDVDALFSENANTDERAHHSSYHQLSALRISPATIHLRESEDIQSSYYGKLTG